MKTKNISFKEMLEIVNEAPTIKEDFLKSVSKCEEQTETSRDDLYYTLHDGYISMSVDPLFETPEQVGEYLKTGKISDII